MFTIKIKRKALRKLKLDQIAARLNNHLTINILRISIG